MSKANKKKIRLNMSVDLNDNCSKSVSEDNMSPSTELKDSIALNIINELNDLITAKRDLIIESFATKRGPIARHQIKDYLNQMIEVVTNKRNDILRTTSSTTTSSTTTSSTTPLSTVDCNAIDISKECHLKSTSTVSESESLEKTSEKVTKSKAKTKSKKSTKRRKSVGRKGIGKLLFDYRNRNKIPDYQKRLKYVERDPMIDILHKKIGLVASRLSAIPESKDEF